MSHNGGDSILTSIQETVALEHTIRRVPSSSHLNVLYTASVHEMRSVTRAISEEFMDMGNFIYILETIRALYVAEWSPVQSDLTHLKDVHDCISLTILPNLKRDQLRILRYSRIHYMNAYEATMEYQITQNRKISSQNNYNKYRIFPIFRWFWKKKSFPAEEMVLFAESNLREAKEGLWDCRALLSQVDAMVTKLEVLLSVIQATYTNGVTISLGNDQQV